MTTPAVPAPTTEPVEDEFVDEGSFTRERLAEAGVAAAAVVGVVLSMQSVSLITGAGIIWAGAAVALAAFVVAYILRLPYRTLIASGVVAAICVACVAYDEAQLNDKRQEISQLFSGVQS
jgi:peptidoglycan/LPS O-acetylase OafA/YrhL